MAFRRRPKRIEPSGVSESNIVELGREMALRDGDAYNAARGAVELWLRAFPEIAQAAGESDSGATTPSLMLVHAFAAASAARAAIGAGERLEAVLTELETIGRDEAQAGSTKEWVVGMLQIRCLAVGNVLSLLGRKDAATAWREVADAYLSVPEPGD
jgi:hypothetical protein